MLSAIKITTARLPSEFDAQSSGTFEIDGPRSGIWLSGDDAPHHWNFSGTTFIDILGIRGSRFADVIAGSRGDDCIYGYGRADRLAGNSGDDLIYGGAGRDALFGNRGNDILRGGAGADMLCGGGGDDRIYGQGGNDVVVFDPHDLTLVNGGAGMDTLLIAGSGITLDLQGFAGDVYRNIEVVDLNDGGANTLLLNKTALQELSPGSDSFRVDGDAGDTLVLDGASWGLTGTEQIDGRDYDTYTSGDVTLQVEQGIHISDNSNLRVAEGNAGATEGDLPASSGDEVDSQDNDGDNGGGIDQGNDGTGEDGDGDNPPGNGGGGSQDDGQENGGGSDQGDGGAGSDGPSNDPGDNGSHKLVGDIHLSELDGVNGFALAGETADDALGFCVSDAGDVNGDGIADIIVGAYRADQSETSTGTAYVIFGNVAGFAADFDLSRLDGSNGFQVLPAASADYTGFSVAAAGDINGDGFDDLLVSSAIADASGVRSGATFVVFGTDSGFGANVDLGALNGVNGFRISGEAASDLSGYSVSGAGDVNGDGIDDFIVGAIGVDTNGSYSGAAYVVFGRASGFDADLDLSALDGTDGFQISGAAADDRFGRSVSGAGDVNGDGIGDLIVGADHADPNGDGSGAAYVIFGRSSGFAANVDVGSLDGHDGFMLDGQSAYDFTGRSVSGAGDVNGDGFADIIVGTFQSRSGLLSGESYVVFGTDSGFAPNIELSDLDGTNGFRLTGAASDMAGVSVSGAGDVNGDGFADLIVGAWTAHEGDGVPGVSYVVFGHGGPFEPDLDLGQLGSTSGFRIIGAGVYDHSGFAVSGAGDVNHDGFDDLLVGAHYADPNGNNSGAAYIVFGGNFSAGDIYYDAGNDGQGALDSAVTLSDEYGDRGLA